MRRFAGIFLALMAISACSWQGVRCHGVRGPADGDRVFAAHMISEIMAANRVLTPFKGLGNIRIRYGKISISARAAWIAVPRDHRLRIEIMGPAGQPVVRLIANSSTAVFSWYDHGSFHTRTLSERSLNPLVHIPIKVDEFILFLAGSIPVKSHDVLFVGRAGNTDRQVAVLRKRWSGVVEKIGFIPDKSGVTDVEVYGWFGSRYRVDMVRDPDLATGNARSTMIFSHGDVSVRIEPDRQWRDVSIPAGAFDMPR